MKILVHPTLPAKSVQDLLEVARRKPNSLNCGSRGWSMPVYFGCELLRPKVSVQLPRVPYEGMRHFDRRFARRVEEQLFPA